MGSFSPESIKRALINSFAQLSKSFDDFEKGDQLKMFTSEFFGKIPRKILFTLFSLTLTLFVFLICFYWLSGEGIFAVDGKAWIHSRKE